jgi:hypothetical protein
MGVGTLQHKGNKSDSSAIAKKPWAYRIGTPQDLLSLVALSAHTAELATDKPLVEFLVKWVWVFFNTKAIN